MRLTTAGPSEATTAARLAAGDAIVMHSERLTDAETGLDAPVPRGLVHRTYGAPKSEGVGVGHYVVEMASSSDASFRETCDKCQLDWCTPRGHDVCELRLQDDV